MAPRANRSTPRSTFLSTTPTKKPAANSNPDPTLKLDFTHRGARLSSNSRTPPYLPNTDSLAIIPPQPHPYESQSAKPSELRFRALLTEGGTKRLELTRA